MIMEGEIDLWWVMDVAKLLPGNNLYILFEIYFSFVGYNYLGLFLYLWA